MTVTLFGHSFHPSDEVYLFYSEQRQRHEAAAAAAVGGVSATPATSPYGRSAATAVCTGERVPSALVDSVFISDQQRTVDVETASSDTMWQVCIRHAGFDVLTAVPASGGSLLEMLSCVSGFTQVAAGHRAHSCKRLSFERY